MSVHSWYVGGAEKRKYGDDDDGGDEEHKNVTLHSLKPVFDDWVLSKGIDVNVDHNDVIKVLEVKFVDSMRYQFENVDIMVSKYTRRVESTRSDLLHRLQKAMADITAFDFGTQEHNGNEYIKTIVRMLKVPDQLMYELKFELDSVLKPDNQSPLYIDTMKFIASRHSEFSDAEKAEFVKYLNHEFDEFIKNGQYHAKLQKYLVVSNDGVISTNAIVTFPAKSDDWQYRTHRDL